MGRLRALALAATAFAFATAAQGAAPPRPTGGLAFGPGTLVDPLRSAAALVLRVDASGVLWVAGASGLLARSTDGGDSFRALPSLAAGEADVVDAGGTAVFAAVDGRGGLAIAGSGDGGATWRAGSAAVVGAASRPWLAADGSSVFLAVGTPAGSEILSAPAGQLSFADAGAPGPETQSTRCGRLVFDPVRRMLHLPCASGSGVEITSANVPPGRRAGLTFTTSVAAVSPVGPVSGPLPSLAVDGAGDAYVVWVDAGTRGLYAARPGSAPVQINGTGADAVALPAAVGGAPGTFAVAYLGAETERDPSTLPDVRSEPLAAAGVRWYGYAALVRDLTATSATVFQQRVTAKPVAFGRICTTCEADPVLGRTIGATLDPETGALRIALPDATDPRHVPQPFVARQLAGPTPLGQSVSRPPPSNGVVDGAEVPQAPQLDLTKLELQQLNPATLRVRMSVTSPALTPPPGAPSGVWMTRFQILSRGQAGEPAYRSIYAAAVSAAGGQPAFTAGEIACDDACRPTSSRPAAGRVEGGAVVVDVNLAALLATVPLEGDLLYNVSGFTFAGDAAGNPVAVLDSLASFDYRLDQRIGPTTGRGRRITVRGTIPVPGGRRASVAVDVRTNRTGTVAYRDVGARVVFRSMRLARVTVRRGVVTISGTGLNGTRRVSFVATLVDRTRRLDSFGIRLSSGYRRSGFLATGEVRIR